jgi:hypothetical protein
MKSNFLKTLKEIEEAITYPEGLPSSMKPHPEKLRDVEAGEVEAMSLFPEDPTAKDYYHMLFSKNYAKCIERLAHYTNTPIQNLSPYPLMSMVLETLASVMAVESRHKEFFETLALDCVLNLEEYAIAKQMKEDGQMIFDVQLGHGELQNALTSAKMQIEEDSSSEEKVDKMDITDTEKAEFNLLRDIMGDEEIKARKALADALLQGDALMKMYLFNMVSQELNDIDTSLVNLYGIASSIVQVLYYLQPKGIEDQAAGGSGAMGSEEVQIEDGVYRVKARGYIFPFLVHEIVKGINHAFSLSKELSPEKRSLESETTDINYGQALAAVIRDLFPDESSMKYRLMIQNLLATGEAGGGFSADEIKTILKGGEPAKALVRERIKEWESEYQSQKEKHEEYLKQKEDYENSSEEDEDEGDDFQIN